MASSTSPTPLLPDDLVLEILVRLPLKSLIRFRCVSKSWNCFTSSYNFAKAHLKRSTKHTDLTRSRIMFNFRGGNMKFCYCPSLFQEPSVDVVDLYSPFLSSRKSVWLVGSCDGLICLVADRKYLILWNPSIRKYIELPDFDFCVDSRLGTQVAYGFGYDKYSDDYKVVVFNGKKDVSDVVKVYSLKSNEWRKVASCHSCWLMSDPAICVNGRLYWTSNPGFYSETGGHIVSFDLGTEEFDVLQMPSDIEDDSYSRLEACNGTLYVVCCYLSHVDLWTMGSCELSPPGTWTKVVSVPCVDDFLRYSYKKLMRVEKNGEVLLLCWPRFVVFNMEDCSFRYPEVVSSDNFYGATTYVESLVSPII